MNTTLTGNTAPEGGAISASSSALNISDALLSGNAALLKHGGAIFHNAMDDRLEALDMTRCTLQNNTCQAAGGAVAAFWSSAVTMTECMFTQNSVVAAAPSGGALMALNVAEVNVADCVFESNWIELVPQLADDSPLGYIDAVAAVGTGKGGAIWLGSDEVMSSTIDNTTLSDNWAGAGGCMYVTGQQALTIMDSTLTNCRAVGYSSEGGGLMVDDGSVVEVTGTYVTSCQAVRGGGSWHGGASRATYTGCHFVGNNALDGDDIKGSAVFLSEDSCAVNITGSEFRQNVGLGPSEGTVTMALSDATLLRIEDSVFDGNVARLGSGFLIAAVSQVNQLSLSGVTFRNNRAYIGGVMYSESRGYGNLTCDPRPCDWTQNNSASDYGDTLATPPKVINVTMPASVRSGAPLPVTVTMFDGFGQQMIEWDNLVVTITTDASIAGSLRTFYTDGSAVFPGLSLRGNESTVYSLVFTLTGPDLFGNDVEEGTQTVPLSVQRCQPGETFDFAAMDCACAVGFGLVTSDHTCRNCTADEVVPDGGLSCVACPALSVRSSLSSCTCQAGYFGTIFGATGACTQCPADTYRSASDPPDACIPCPTTSHTFALGATSATDCLCAQDTFNDMHGVNSSFSCAAVPQGACSRGVRARCHASASSFVADALRCF